MISLLVSLTKSLVSCLSDCFLLDECTLAPIDVTEQVSEQQSEPKLTKTRTSQRSISPICLLRYMLWHKLKFFLNQFDFYLALAHFEAKEMKTKLV